MEFKHPSTILISGPTGSGKSEFVGRLILERMLDPMPNKIIWIYGEWQPLYDKLSMIRNQIEFIHGVPPNFYENLNPNFKNLVILDDQMSKSTGDKTISKIFTEGSHHKNTSVIYIVQNLFSKGAEHRTISLNSQYIVVFKNPRDKSQIQSIARQMFPNRVSLFVDVFNDATNQPYGYLIIDLRPDTPEDYRLRTHIFPGEEPTVYGL